MKLLLHPNVFIVSKEQYDVYNINIYSQFVFSTLFTIPVNSMGVKVRIISENGIELRTVMAFPMSLCAFIVILHYCFMCKIVDFVLYSFYSFVYTPDYCIVQSQMY